MTQSSTEAVVFSTLPLATSLSEIHLGIFGIFSTLDGLKTFSRQIQDYSTVPSLPNTFFILFLQIW